MNALRTSSATSITGPFLSGHALREGWLSKRQIYSSLFVPLFHGVHVPAAIPITHVLRCQAAALIAPSEAVLTGASAAAARGLDLVGRDAPVEFVVPEAAKFRRSRGIDMRRTTLLDIDSEPWNEIRIATPLRMAMDMLTNTRLHSSLPRVVGMLDALLREGDVDAAALWRLLHNLRDHGIVRARHALSLADSRAESIPESELRVWLVRAGLNPIPQRSVYSDGVFLGRLDLAIDECKLGVEYNGQWHDEPVQVEYDVKRREALRQAGWELIVVGKDDLYGNPHEMVQTVLSAIRRRMPAR